MRDVIINRFLSRVVPMSDLHTTTALLGLGLALLIMWLLRRDHLHASHGFFWLIVAALAGMLGIWPRLIDFLATVAGISYPPALLFLAAVIALIVKALHADILNTRVEREVRRLNQRLALLEMDLARFPAPGRATH